jgi:hypothetical protein
VQKNRLDAILHGRRHGSTSSSTGISTDVVDVDDDDATSKLNTITSEPLAKKVTFTYI